MAKFHGKVGYGAQQETAPGVWNEVITDRTYRGDILQNVNRWKDSEKVNDDMVMENRISIISDPFAYANLSTIRCVEWMGTRWKVTKIEILRPRLILTIGGVFNEQSG